MSFLPYICDLYESSRIEYTNNGLLNSRPLFHVKLVYQEQFSARWKAEKREKQIKKWSVAKKNALINGNIELLKKLSKGH